MRHSIQSLIWISQQNMHNTNKKHVNKQDGSAGIYFAGVLLSVERIIFHVFDGVFMWHHILASILLFSKKNRANQH